MPLNTQSVAALMRGASFALIGLGACGSRTELDTNNAAAIEASTDDVSAFDSHTDETGNDVVDGTTSTDAGCAAWCSGTCTDGRCIVLFANCVDAWVKPQSRPAHTYPWIRLFSYVVGPHPQASKPQEMPLTVLDVALGS